LKKEKEQGRFIAADSTIGIDLIDGEGTDLTNLYLLKNIKEFKKYWEWIRFEN
jgi:hypothetical protein